MKLPEERLVSLFLIPCAPISKLRQFVNQEAASTTV